MGKGATVGGALAAALALSGCISGKGSLISGDAFRIRTGAGVAIQCKSREIYECGVVLKDCSDSHEYLCLHGMDIEVADAASPLPPPLTAPAPAAKLQQPAPAPAPLAPPAPRK